MQRRLRVDVLERHEVGVLVDHLGRNLGRGDAAEQATGHGPDHTRAPGTGYRVPGTGTGLSSGRDLAIDAGHSARFGSPAYPAFVVRRSSQRRLPEPLQLKVHGRLEELRQPAPYRLPHEGQPAGGRTGGDCPLGIHGPVRADCARARRAAEVRAARWAAVRQRPDPHRSRAQQDPEGLRRQVEVHGRLRRAVRAGLGLPRPADRNSRSTRNSDRRSAT